VHCFFYFAYGYYYGETVADYGSPLRYVMPMSLALFYCGALGLEHIIGQINRSQRAGIYKLLFVLPLAALTIHKLF